MSQYLLISLKKNRSLLLIIIFLNNLNQKNKHKKICAKKKINEKIFSLILIYIF